MIEKPGYGKRAQRRHDLDKRKKRARHIYPHDRDGKLANHLAICSCPICGNPRRHFGQRTIQEIRAEISQAQQS